MASPRVAIVLVNYNGRELLDRYLPSLMSLTYDNTEVVVVDNDSSDGSVPFLRAEFPEVTVVESGANLGFSAGNNAGVAAAGDADYYWFVNTDVEVEADSLSTLVEYIEAHPQTGMVVPQINYADDRDTIQSVGFECNAATLVTPRDHGQQTPSNPDPHPVTFGSGAALLVDRDVWDSIGGFDGEHFMFADDSYLGLRCWMLGYQVEAVPDAVVYHEVGGTRERSVDPKVSFHYTRGHVRMTLKLLQWRSVAVGAPRFLAHILFLVAADALYRRSPKAALYRFLGYLAPLSELPELLRQRRSIQRTRTRPDSAILDPGW